MTMKKIVIAVAALCLPAALTFYFAPQTWRNLRLQTAAYATTTPTPFYVETVETLVSKDGVATEAGRYITARNSTGAFRLERRGLVGLTPHDVRIVRPDRIATVHHPALNMKRTILLTTIQYAEEVGSRQDPAKKCAGSIGGGDPVGVGPSSIEEEVVSGVRAFKLSWTAKESNRISWRAPDLGCVEIKRRQTYADNNSASNLDMLSYSTTEPPAAVFQVPEGMLERSPLQIQDEGAKLKGLDKDPQYAHTLGKTRSMFNNMERVYWAQRPPQ